MVAGRSTARTIVASIRIATARPTPSCFIDWSEPVANATNVTTMTAAAPVITPAALLMPSATAFSVGSAYGVLTLVFQDGRFEKELGFTSVGGITPWLPLFLFVVLFGLSMDYHVFVLSRVRELVDRGMSTDKAVAEGIKSTAGVITSAAAVMVVTFSAFAIGDSQDMKQLGVGLAVAILIDATIVRAVLLPATMKLLGKRNWYLPKGLQWLPKFEHEPTVAPAGA